MDNTSYRKDKLNNNIIITKTKKFKKKHRKA